MDKPPHFYFYNNNVAPVFYMIEKNGMGIDKHDLDKFYEILHESYSISDDKIFTQYNLYTTTRRPSNSFNSVNFAALNKDSGARKSFIAQNDYLVEFDISSYHPTLANKLMGGDFDISQLYEQVGKENVFRQLYGGIQEQHWLNLYRPLTGMQIDRISDQDPHPGPLSQAIFTQYLLPILEEKLTA